MSVLLYLIEVSRKASRKDVLTPLLSTGGNAKGKLYASFKNNFFQSSNKSLKYRGNSDYAKFLRQ